MTVSESQAKHAHLLTPARGETKDQMWAWAWQFTNNVCFDNRAAYAMIKKTGGRVCGPGVDCDKIIEVAAPHRIYDLVRSAGSAAAEPIFDYTNHNGKPVDFAAPLAYDQSPTPVPPPTGCQFPPRDQGLLFFTALDDKYRVRGYQPTPYFVDMEGTSVWYAQYLLYRTQGLDHAQAQARVFADIDAVWAP